MNAHDTIDLRTAQNHVHSFVLDATESWRSSGAIAAVHGDPERRTALALETEALLFQLLGIPAERAGDFSMGIADSGKRAIEVMVNVLGTSGAGETVAVSTENYVGHNKWSAAHALEKYRGVAFSTPFDLALGEALTVHHETELDKAKRLIEGNVPTFYLAWNGTSTGVEERVDELVAFRNQVGSSTLIMADASSLCMLSKRWESIPFEHLPDAFFFSFRKHLAIPYDGAQDEIEQMQRSGSVLVFGPRAIARAETRDCEPLYGFDFSEIRREKAPQGEMYVTHLMRLNAILERMTENGGEALEEIDHMHSVARHEILDAFAADGPLGRLGLALVTDPAAQSRSSYVLRVPAELSASGLLKRLEEERVVVSPALHPQGNTKQHNIIRFGIYSANTIDDVRGMLSALERSAIGMSTSEPRN